MLDKVTDFVLFISKLLCVSAVGVGSFFFFNGDIDYVAEYVPKLNYFFAPVIVSTMYHCTNSPNKDSSLINKMFYSIAQSEVSLAFLKMDYFGQIQIF